MAWDIIDNALTATNERSSEYGRVAYRQGFMDAIQLSYSTLEKMK